ncbi:hypothetical protein TGGT1_225000 [Toxoplasma gondii GT1]|uniref:Enhancer of polycomb-like protein n=2 Tax=Toxoplasma gondii TaxID=5811 RepID=S7UWV9_TOXGG|nr:hypothetical protein TGGT1_225000 [Toxoplasma gondii GT1]KAF4640542.1 hypothetical protein TGRH88_044680 [Toxoplasma gondii]
MSPPSPSRAAASSVSSVRTSVSARPAEEKAGGSAGPPSAAKQSASSPSSPSALSSRVQTWAPSGKGGAKVSLSATAASAVSSLPPPQRQLRTRHVDATKRLFVIRKYEDLEQLAEEEGVRIDPVQLGFLSPTEFVEEDVAALGAAHRAPGVGGAAKKRKQKMIVVPPIKIEESHDADLPDFVRPDHYIRFDQHRDQPTGLRLPDGSLVHYDMLKEDELFVEELNRRVALFAPPALRSSLDLFTLGDSETPAEADMAKSAEVRLTVGDEAVKNERSASQGSSGEAGASSEGRPGRLFEAGGGRTKRRREGEDGEKLAETNELKGELFLSEIAFVKMVDAFEKEVHAKGGNEHSLTQKDAVRIAREDLKLKIHPVLVKQVLMYWLEKRQKLGKPLLRHFWPPCSPSDVSPLAVFRPRQVGREKMTLRKQKRVGKDTLLRAERLLEDIKVVERLLRRMRSRDEKKEQLLEVQFMAFDQMRFEISDPLYHHPLWDAFRERLTSKGEKSRRHAASEKRNQASRACREEAAARLRASADTHQPTAPVSVSSSSFPSASAVSSSSSARRKDRSSSVAGGLDQGSAVGSGEREERGRGGVSGDRRVEETGRKEAEAAPETDARKARQDGDRSASEAERKKRELEEDECAMREGAQQVDEILGDGSPPWVTWSRGNRHLRPCFFPPASTFAYLSSLSSATSPLPPSLVPPPPAFLNDSSALALPSCRIVRRRGRGGRLWLDRLLCRPHHSASLSENAFVPSSRFASRLPQSSLRQTRALFAGDGASGTKDPGCPYTASGPKGSRRDEEAEQREPTDSAAHANAGNFRSSESTSAGRREDGSSGVSTPQSSGVGDATDEKRVSNGLDEAPVSKDAQRVKEEGDSAVAAREENASANKRESKKANAQAPPLSQSHANAWKRDAQMQKGFPAWPRQHGLYVQSVRDDKAVGTDRYSPPFATADGVDAPENTGGLHVFSLHRHLAQQEQLASAAASFAASSTLAPRRSPDGWRHLAPPGAPGLASPRRTAFGLRGQEGLACRVMHQGVPVFGGFGGQPGTGLSIALSPYGHPGSLGAPGRLPLAGPLGDAGGVGPGAFGLPHTLAAGAPGAQGQAFFPPGTGPGCFPTSGHPFAFAPSGPAGPLAQPATLAAQFASRGGPGLEFSGGYGLPGAGNAAPLNASLFATSCAQPSFYYNPATGVSLVSSYAQPQGFARPPGALPTQGPFAQAPGRGSAAGQVSQFFYSRQSPPSPASGAVEANKTAPAGDAAIAPREGEDARSVAYAAPTSQSPGSTGFSGRGPVAASGASNGGGSGSAGTGDTTGFFRPGDGGSEAGTANSGAQNAPAGTGASGPAGGAPGQPGGSQAADYSQVYRQQFQGQGGLVCAVPAQFFGAAPHPSQGAPCEQAGPSVSFPPAGAFYPPARGPGAPRAGSGPRAGDSDPATAAATFCRQTSQANFKGWLRVSSTDFEREQGRAKSEGRTRNEEE